MSQKERNTFARQNQGRTWYGRSRPVPRGQNIDKYFDMIAGVVAHVIGMLTHFLKERVEIVLPVKELPQIDAGGVQTKPTTGIRIEEHGPVVKLLPEHDVWVGYGLFIVFQDAASPFPPLPPRTAHRLIEGP